MRILIFWKGTCKWKESGLNLVNYIERVSETGKLTMLCRTCVYGITETKQTKHEKVKGYLRKITDIKNHYKPHSLLKTESKSKPEFNPI